MGGPFSFATIEDEHGVTAAVVRGDRAAPLPGRPSMAELLADWDRALDRTLPDEEGAPLDSLRLLPPVPSPPNLYMVGANYASHAREMRGLGPDDPVERPPEGPFVFLKPTTTLVGHRAHVELPSGYRSVDHEVELAVVIGRFADRVDEASALDHVAGYTVANDVSVRDAFRRGEHAEPPMRFDWFAQKGRRTTCPAGPVLVPARFLPDPDNLDIRLTVNAEVRQQSNTSEMLFSVAEIVAYVSGIVPLVPGDVICTGTCAGVAAATGKFLAPGDVVSAEIEGIGALVNDVVDG
jgi:2-keto-4-pentenoate hydratase/2-oxohepta-3-ene-1,7-dioic acid hydratase in catechol pathway